MNDFYKGVILSILRKALTGVSAWAITNGWLTGDQTTEITLGIAGLVVSVGLSLWDQYSSQLVKLAALQLPKGATMDDAKALAKTESAPTVTTASDVAPKPATTADIAKATGAGIPPLLVVLALLPGLLLAPACKGKIVTTPAGAAKVEADVLGVVRDASAVMLAEYKAGHVPATISDPYFDALDTKVLPVARRVKAAIVAWHLAAEGPAKVKSAGDLQVLLGELETEARNVFGMTLPAGVAQSINTVAQQLWDAIAKVRVLIKTAAIPARGSIALAEEN